MEKKNICIKALGKDHKKLSKDEESKIKEEILNEYQKMHPSILKHGLENIKKQIDTDIDPSVYIALSEYDKKSGVTNSKLDYINIMLKNIRKKQGESLSDYKKREAEKRNKLFKNFNIEIDYTPEDGFKLDRAEQKKALKYAKVLNGKAFSLKEKFLLTKPRHLSVKGFAKKNDNKRIVVENKEQVSKEMKKIKKSALKSPKSASEFVSEELDELSPSKEQLEVTAPKGFFKKLKDKKEKDPKKFRKNSIIALILAGAISLSVTAAYFNHNSKTEEKQTDEIEMQLENEENSNDQLNFIIEENAEDIDNNVEEDIAETNNIAEQETLAEETPIQEEPISEIVETTTDLETETSDPTSNSSIYEMDFRGKSIWHIKYY